MELGDAAKLIVFSVALLALIVSRFIRVSWFLSVAGFMLPLVSLTFVIGVNLGWSQILGPIALALSVLTDKKPKEAPSLRAAAPFVIWAVVISIGWAIAEYSVLERYHAAEARGLGPAQAYYRIPVQIVSYLTQFSALAVVPMAARTRAEANAAFDGLALGIVVSIGVGILGLALGQGGMIVTGGDQVQVDIGGVGASRLGGLSREPRHLGAFIVTSLPYIIVGIGKPKTLRVRLVLICMYAVGLVLTFSTSSWVALIISICAYLAVSLVDLRMSHLLAGAGVCALALTVYSQSTSAQDAVEARIYKRLTDDQIEGEKDYFLVKVYSDQPEHIGTGFGLGGFDLAALRYADPVPYYKPAAFSLTPTSNIGRLAGEVGLLGLVLFGAMVLGWFRTVRRNVGRPDAAALISATGGLMFVSITAFASYMFVVGVCLTLSKYHHSI